MQLVVQEIFTSSNEQTNHSTFLILFVLKERQEIWIKIIEIYMGSNESYAASFLYKNLCKSLTLKWLFGERPRPLGSLWGPRVINISQNISNPWGASLDPHPSWNLLLLQL